MKRITAYGSAAGVLLLLAGTFVYLINASWTTIATTLVVAGAALLLAGGVVHLEKVRSFITRRSTRYGANAVILSIFVLGIIGIANFTLSRHNWRADTTESGQFSLADQTVKVLKGLEIDLDVKAFQRQTESGRLDDLLGEYANYSSKFNYEIVDPDREPDLAKSYGVKKYGEIIIRAGANEERVEDVTEEKLTNALIKVTRTEQRKVYFLSGHGEKSFELGIEERESYSLVSGELNKVNYVTEKLELFQIEAMPEDASIVLIAGPTKPLFPAETKLIRDYLVDGGSVFFLFEGSANDTALENLVAELGVELHNDVVLEQSASFILSGGGLKRDMRVSIEPTAAAYGEHRITEDFRLATAFPTTRSMALAGEEDGDYELTELIFTSQSSWGETDLALLEQRQTSRGEGDIQGPVTIGVVGKVKEGRVGGRFVVLGDSDFPSDPYVERAPGNKDLFLNTVSWLADDEDLISIRPKDPQDRRVNMTMKEGKVVFYLIVIALPILILMSGIGIYAKRRR